jgi:RHS repeat-associated protein
MKSHLCFSPAFIAILTLSGTVFAQSALDESKVQTPQLAAPQRGSLAGQYASTEIGAAEVTRGSFSLASPFSFPTERGTPLGSFFPSYSPENGLSEWGLGWANALCIERFNAVGTVTYLADGRRSPWGPLQLGTDGYWYGQGLQNKIRFEEKNDSVTAFLPDGSRYTFGNSAASKIAGPLGTYAWCLAEAETLVGARTLFEYEVNASKKLFLRTVRYGPKDSQLPTLLEFLYESLDTPLNDFRPGFNQVLDRRVVAVAAKSQNADTGAFVLRWRHDVVYEADALGPAFFLKQVQQVFASQEKAPAVVYTYAKAKTWLEVAAFVRTPKLSGPMAEKGSEVFFLKESTLVDANNDGRLDFENRVEQQLYIQEDFGFRKEDLPPLGAGANRWCREYASEGNPTRLLADVANTGSLQVVATGAADLSATPLYICNREGETLAELTLPGYFPLGANGKLVDVNRDNRPDVVRVESGRYTVVPNVSDAGGYRLGTIRTGTLKPEYQAQATWLYDINGDGLADIVSKFAGGWPVVWFGLGDFRFEEEGKEFPLFDAQGEVLSGLRTYAYAWADFNKDGLADIVATKGSDVILLFNTGTSFRESRFAFQYFLSASTGVIAGDFSGDGNTHLTTVAYDNGSQAYSVALDAANTALLISADDGKGTVVSFDYARSPAVPGARQRQAVLEKVTVASSGQDAVASVFRYASPKLHSQGRFLLGFESVGKRGPHTDETVSFRFEDSQPALVLASQTADDLAPQVVGFEQREYQPSTAFGVAWQQPVRVVAGLRSADNVNRMEEKTAFLSYDEALCVKSSRRTTVHGTLETAIVRASVPSLVRHLHCLEERTTLQGLHGDASFNFTLSQTVARNALGQVTRVSNVGDEGSVVQQEVGYNTDNTVAFIASKASGASQFAYDMFSRQLTGIVEPSGVKTTVQRDAVTGQVKQLSIDRGAAPFQQVFRYDGQERLLKQWNNTGTASENNPNETYAYKYADALSPGVGTAVSLVDGVTQSKRQTASFTSGAGETMADAVQVPDGWALGAVRQYSGVDGLVKTGLRAAFGSTEAMGAVNYAQLLTGVLPLATQQRSAAGVVRETEKFHAGVERQLLSVFQVAPAGLTATTTENNTSSVTRLLDASSQTLSQTTESGHTYRYQYDVLGRVRTVQLPDLNVHAVSFDSYGRLAQVTRSQVATVVYAYEAETGRLSQKSFLSPARRAQRREQLVYDAIGRVVEEKHTDIVTGAEASFVFRYDGLTQENQDERNALGLLSEVAGSGYRKTFAYRPDGKLLTEKLALTAFRTLQRQFSYFDNDSVKSVATTLFDAANNVVTSQLVATQVDAYGRASSWSLNGAPWATLSYDGNNQLSAASFVDGTAVSLKFDADTRALVGLRHVSATVDSKVERRFGPRGRAEVESFRLGAATVERHYGYSPEAFLQSATDTGDSSEAYGYSFDAVGFLKEIRHGAQTRAVTGAFPELFVGNVRYAFDSLGRIQTKGSLVYAYGPTGQVDSVQTPEGMFRYVYDENGQRMLKESPSGARELVWGSAFVDESGLTEVTKLGRTVVGVVKNGVFEAVPVDFKGTVVAAKNGERRLAAPHGERVLRSEVARVIDYVEKGYDAELHSYRMGLRDYDEKAGMFLSADPLYLERPERCIASPQQCNLYGYAGGDPVGFVDPQGTDAFSEFMYPGLAQAPPQMRFLAALEPLGKAVTTALTVEVGVLAGLVLTVGTGGLASLPLVAEAGGTAAVVGAADMATVATAGRVAGAAANVGRVVGPAATAGAAAVDKVKQVGGLVAVRAGQAGEAAVRRVADIGGKMEIFVNARVRIPDGITREVLSEVKNVNRLSYTQQLRDYAAYAQQKGLRFDLWVRQDTQLSQTLEQEVTNRSIILRYIP